MNKCISLVLLLCAGCGDVVSGDATADASADGAREDIAADIPTTADSPDVVLVDWTDGSDNPSAPDVVDVHDDQPLTDADVPASDGSVTVPPCIGPEPRPAGVGRSCLARDGGIDPRLCDEVHYCGGAFIGGSANAYVRNGLRPIENLYRYESCDYYPAIALSGYVDSYEVTVGRFRAWVNAGMPSPNVGDFIADGIRWTNDDVVHLRNAQLPFFDSAIPANDPRPRMEACTWTLNEGPNELRPINCMDITLAKVFCAWDGKQLLSEIAWEYLARNRGTTEVPFGNSRNDPSICNIADVGGWVAAPGGTLCPSTTLPRSVLDRPMDVTSNPPGIYGLFGGVSEFVFRSVYDPPGIDIRSQFGINRCVDQRRSTVLIDGQVEDLVLGALVLRVPVGYYTVRGASWFDRNEFDVHRFSASLLHVTTTYAAEGFRCGRRERPMR